jgi:ribosomal protein S18 acetylase RimI-like enzyme
MQNNNKTTIVNISETRDLWDVLDFLLDEFINNANGDGFWYSRQYITTAFIADRMFTVVQNDREIVSFCVLDEDGQIEMIWTRPEFRKRGHASLLVRYFKPKYIKYSLKDAIPFWNKMCIPILEFEEDENEDTS